MTAQLQEQFDILTEKSKKIGTGKDFDRKGWKENERKLEQSFRHLMEAKHIDFELPEKGRDAIWEKAWEDGHSSGFPEVEIYYEELVELIEICLEPVGVKP